jgi:hypothetical protein
LPGSGSDSTTLPAHRRLLLRVRDLLESLPDPGDGFSRLEWTQKALRLRAANGRDGAGAPFWELSKREIDVLRLLPGHLSQREMAPNSMSPSIR